MDTTPVKEKLEVILKQAENNDQGFQISLKEFIEAIIKHKRLIAVIAVICIMVGAISSFFLPYKGKVSAIISFNFDGIEKGVDPYGKSFDVSKIKSPAVIDKVVKELNLERYKITSSKIIENLNIEPVIPGDITQKIKDLEEARKQNIKELQDFTYYPNTYMIALDLHRRFSINKKLAEKILNEVVKQYKEYFYYSYSDREVLSNVITNINYNDYDYPEVSMILQNQLDIIKNYLSRKNQEPEASIFRSKKTGLAFSDIIETVNVIEKVDLNRIDATIGSYNLTKDKDKLIKLYQYRIEVNNLAASKRNDESNVYGSMLNKYQKDRNVILVPGLTQGENSSSSIEVDKTNDYYDELVGKYSTAGVDSKNRLHDSEYYKVQIQRLEKDNVPPELKKAAVEDILRLLPDIKSKIENWIRLTNDTVAEYYDFQLNNKAVSSISPAVYSGNSMNMALYLAAALIIGLLIGLVAALFKEYWEKNTPTTEITEKVS
ncbi:MAG: Wzz/FepE/Etk N-terminal domain-containing protein [Deltaproteobacteria bacterium]